VFASFSSASVRPHNWVGDNAISGAFPQGDSGRQEKGNRGTEKAFRSPQLVGFTQIADWLEVHSCPSFGVSFWREGRDGQECLPYDEKGKILLSPPESRIVIRSPQANTTAHFPEQGGNKSMRTFQRWGSWLSLLVILAAGPIASAQVQPGQVAAIVNGAQIPVSDLQTLLTPDRPPPQPLTETEKKAMQQMALDMLINDVLMRQFLAKNAPQITQNEVTREIAILEKALVAKNLSLKKFLEDSKQTEKEFYEDTLARLQWEAYVNNALPEPLLKKYYDANKVFFDKVFVTASHVLVKVDPKAEPAEKQAARYKAQQIRQYILNGQITFENAAKNYSDCPSKDKGGDIGQFPYKFAVAEPFARTSFSMNVGEISDVIETGFGFHIIKVTARTPGEPSRFDDIKDIVRDVYAQDLQLQQRILADERAKAKIQILLQ
jgi:parvulin-like peptidyl-prolyl isomerase